MIHLGDITKISGYDVPIVDVITGGSPCQDLSVAGKRAGLAGERSGLFMEQMRIVKEMRSRYVRDTGRTGVLVRPRYMVWENVPGAFSSGSPKGADFQAVLEEIVGVVCKEAPPVPVPKEVWPKAGCISGVGDSGCAFSIAWRVHDAQFWGVPQRRKRIALVADFGGLSAPEILFERKGLSGDSEPCGEAREETAGAVGGGAESAIGFTNRGYDSGSVAETLRSDPHGAYPMVARSQSVGVDVYNQEITGDVAASLTAAVGGTNTSGCKVMCLNDQGGSVMGVSEDVTGALRAQEHGHQPVVAFAQNQRNEVRDLGDKAGALAAEPGMKQQTYVVAFKQGQGSKAGGIGAQEECAPTLSAVASGTNQVPVVVSDVLPFDTTQVTSDKNWSNPHYGDPCHPLAAGMHPPAVAIGNGQFNQMSMAEQAHTLNTMHDQQAVLTYAPDVAHSLHAKANCQFREDAETYVAAVDCRNGVENPDINGTLQAKSTGGIGVNFQNVCRTGSIVRRLTPLECERLQGFPDGWTDIGEWTDSKGKKHKEADSPRYKALGNSIALPFWQWLARRICAQYERNITMASLFDGIGGFPLVFERCGAKAVWASEIEEFPIAVTKRHFPAKEATP